MEKRGRRAGEVARGKLERRGGVKQMTVVSEREAYTSELNSGQSSSACPEDGDCFSGPVRPPHEGLSSFNIATAASLYSSPAAPASPPTSPWLSLESPDSFLHLQDIDDSWLDSLPPLNISDASSIADIALAQLPPPSRTCSPPAYLAATPNNPFTPSAAFTEPTPPNSLPPSSSLLSSVPSTSPSPEAQRCELTFSSRSDRRKWLKRLDLSMPTYFQLSRTFDSAVFKDGFKWRKYGQKSLKNSIFPRSYYKCSYKGCHVHKHVERLTLNPFFIATTYKGRHTHRNLS